MKGEVAWGFVFPIGELTWEDGMEKAGLSGSECSTDGLGIVELLSVHELVSNHKVEMGFIYPLRS